MTWKVAIRELALSGAGYNGDIHDKKIFGFLNQFWQRTVSDRVRTCCFQSIMDRKTGPFDHYQEFILSRKSMGDPRPTTFAGPQ